MKRAILAALFLSSSAFAADIRANNCEAFLDKIRIEYANRGGLVHVQAFVKLYESKLDAPVEGVYYYGHSAASTGSYPRISDSGWNRTELQPFANSSNYFVMNLDLPTHSSESFSEGSFFVKTTAGTNYWVNAEGGNNFIFNANFVEGLLSNRSIIVTSNVGAVSSTGSYSRYLNPNGCM